MMHTQRDYIEPTTTTCRLTQLLLIILAISSILSCTEAYIITLDSNDIECFHERVPIGTKLGFSFEVMEGGFYDIDVEIKDPTNAILHQDERTSSGKFTIEANMDGPYQFCMSNHKSSQAPKVIIFEIDKSELPRKWSATEGGEEGKDDETNKLASMVDNLMLATISARHDVRYLTTRDRIHRIINEKTNSTVVWWTGIEFFLLLMVTFLQVWYLKRFFEVRRKA